MRSQRSVLVAYSGGVDSAYLSFIATAELGSRALIVTGSSASVSVYQLKVAIRLARQHCFRHIVIDTHEIKDPNYIRNRGDRCYFCKNELYRKLKELSFKEFDGAVVVDGTNADDIYDIRPGRKAAEALGVVSPLADLGFRKQEIRRLSKRCGLETWDQPASPCLASRISVGVPVSIKRLDRVEKGEDILRDFGFREFRLRVDEKDAKIEIAHDEMTGDDFMNKIRRASERIKLLGFDSVRLDTLGYRSGSANKRGNPNRSSLIEVS